MLPPEEFLPATLTHLELESGRTTIPILTAGEGAVWLVDAGTLTRITPWADERAANPRAACIFVREPCVYNKR